MTRAAFRAPADSHRPSDTLICMQEYVGMCSDIDHSFSNTFPPFFPVL